MKISPVIGSEPESELNVPLNDVATACWKCVPPLIDWIVSWLGVAKPWICCDSPVRSAWMTWVIWVSLV